MTIKWSTFEDFEPKKTDYEKRATVRGRTVNQALEGLSLSDKVENTNYVTEWCRTPLPHQFAKSCTFRESIEKNVTKILLETPCLETCSLV